MISYSEILEQRSKINSQFPALARKVRSWQNYANAIRVLHFGSGDVKKPNHREIENYFSIVKSCDSDPLSGSDYRDVYSIEEKFDLIIAEHVLEHIETAEVIEKLSKKLFELLDLKGRLVITVPNLYCLGTFLSDHDHKNLSPPTDTAAIFCCRGFDLVEYYRWSKSNFMSYQNSMTEFEKSLEVFIDKNYGLQTDRYITMVLQKNG